MAAVLSYGYPQQEVSKMIKPTVGRVVWYWPLNAEPQGQPQAALIAWVHSDTLVNLAVFDPNGNGYSRTSVLLYQGDGERPTGEICEWMPYQIGQAARQLHPVPSS
jgi:hypothetical protein